MKTKKLYGDFLQLSVADLESKLSDLKKEHLTLRCKKSVGQIEDTSTLSKVKKNIARVKTILAQKSLDGSNADSKK